MFAVQRQTARSWERRSGKRSPERAYASAPPMLAVQRASCACGGSCPRCSVPVSQRGDALEREAEAMAHQALRPVHASGAASVQPQRWPARPTSVPAVEADALPASVAHALDAPSVALDPATRGAMESRLQHDFSTVRVHTGTGPAASASELDAYAYTLGNHVVFAAGRYAPGTADGDRLLAHELTHTIQQGASSPLPHAGLRVNGTMPPISLQRSAAPVIQRDGPGSTATSTTGTGTTATGATGAGSAAPADPCAEGIAETRKGALEWLDRAYAELLEFDVSEAFPPPAGSPADPAQERRGRILLRTFRTRDLGYVEVIRRRLLHMAYALRAGEVTITCKAPGDLGCRAAGSSFTAAYVERPFALVMCSVGVAGSRPVQTFVHELAHAVVPEVGITMKRGDAGRGVRDRAYEHERLFRYMTPEEALDNADSYGLLVEQLATAADVEVATSPVDTAAGCKDPGQVVAAIARFEQWTRDADRWLEAVVTFLTPASGALPFSDLPEDERKKLEHHFPGVSSVSGLQDLAKFYERMEYALNISVDVTCAKAGGNCTGSTLGYASSGSVTGSAASVRKLKAKESINLCPDWFDTSDDERVASLYALFILSRPSWMTSAIALADVFKYAGLAGERHREITPAPTTRSAREHLEAGRTP